MNPQKTIMQLKSGKPVTLVALGDSLTYGWMVGKGYLDFLSDMIAEKYPAADLEIINRGIPGDTAGGGLSRLREDVIEYRPDCVLVQFALNDYAMGVPPELYRNQLDAIMDQTRAATGADCILVTSVCLDSADDAIVDRYYARMEECAGRFSAPIARVHAYWKQKIAAGVQFRGLVQSDGVHPTELGYRFMAEAIMALF